MMQYFLQIAAFLFVLTFFACREEVTPTFASNKTSTLEYKFQNSFTEDGSLLGVLWQLEESESDEMFYLLFDSDSIHVYTVDIDTAYNQFDIDSNSYYYQIEQNQLLIGSSSNEFVLTFSLSNNLLTLKSTYTDCDNNGHCEEQTEEAFYYKTSYRSIYQLPILKENK